jgi:endonuclease/exonuclease/phosphatase family metal-dependent hydrolase
VSFAALVISVLSYNVHGLPSFAVDDDPAARMPQISQRLNAYDVALLQEDWTWFAALDSAATHPLKERGGGADPPLFHSGLSSFARARLVDATRESLGACSGWLGGANDCLADKGFLRLRLRLGDGAVVDFWNLHLDAGSGDADRAARAVQLERLAERMRALSDGAAVVVAGDFNLQETNPADRALLGRFAAALALSDTGARSAPDGRFAAKRIDFILYRGASQVALEPLEAGEAREFANGATPLSDHPALYARFRVAPASAP